MITRRTFLSALIASPVISQVPAAKPIESTPAYRHAVQTALQSAIPSAGPHEAQVRKIILKSRGPGWSQLICQMANSGASDEQIAKLTSVWLSDSDIPGTAKAIEDLREVKA